MDKEKKSKLKDKDKPAVLLTKNKPIGRPLIYSQNVADTICKRMIKGESLFQICESLNIDYGNVFDWIKKYPEFSDNYAKARQLQAEFKNDEISRVAYASIKDEINPKAARVFIDAMKWQAGRMAPKKYGDKIEIESTGTLTHKVATISVDMTPQEAAQAYQEFINKKD